MSSSDTTGQQGESFVADTSETVGQTDTSNADSSPQFFLDGNGSIPPGLPSNGGGTTVVFDDFGSTNDDVWNPYYDGYDAQEFTSSSGNSVVTDVQLLLYSYDSTDGGDVTVQLRANSSGSPGSVIATLGTIADSALSESGTTVDLSVSVSPTLSGSTQYWLAVTASMGEINWAASQEPTGTGLSGESEYAASQLNPVDGEAFFASITAEAACFAAGTRILTLRGEVPVESLQPGDRVVATHGGVRFAPVRWVGRRRVAPSRHPRPWAVNPVRIRAGALGPDQPLRDLIVSPDHALFLDGVLVRARDLLNGATVVQEPAEAITYFHVELDRHDVLLADGAPAESFLDTGNRAAFENGGTTVMKDADFARDVWARDACAELVWRGPKLAELRALVATQAARLGWTQTDDPGLHVLANGTPLRPRTEGTWLTFALPEGCDQVTLASRVAAPADVLADNSDTRRLGIAVTTLTLDGATLPLDDAALGEGWMAPEASLRWAGGAAHLRTGGARQLSLRIAPLLRYWLPPQAEDVARAA